MRAIGFSRAPEICAKRPLLSVALCALVFAVPAHAQTMYPIGPALQASTSTMSPAMAPLQVFSSFAPVLDHVIPAVVTMLVTGQTLVPKEMGPRAPGGAPGPLPDPERKPFRSGGSGVIIDASKGLILTNNHVVADGTGIEVFLSDGRRFKGALVGRDPGTDVAVVKIEASGLQQVSVGDSDRARVGDVVLAIGNPFGLQGTATLGIISATMRANIGHEAFEDFMQIDAAINPGNSGGALVNVRGELIGINTVGPGEGNKASGIGFAIPINMARTIMNELVTNGTMRRGSTGIAVEDLSRETIERLGMRITRGVQITSVAPGSPGSEAGIPVGSIVKALGGKPIRSVEEWKTRVAVTPLGSRIAIELEVDGRDRTSEIAVTAFRAKPNTETAGPDFGILAGIALADIEPGHQLYGALRGVEVWSVPSAGPAFASGLIAGDVIASIDDIPVRSFTELHRRVSGAGREYRVAFIRGNVPAFIRVRR